MSEQIIKSETSLTVPQIQELQNGFSAAFQLVDDIRKGLEKKLDAMVNREVYSKSKTAPTEEEREKFRQEYLDRKGMQESFRW